MNQPRESREHKTIRVGRKIICVLLAMFIMAFLSACGSKEEEILMGRYADREVKLPDSGYAYCTRVRTEVTIYSEVMWI